MEARSLEADMKERGAHRGPPLCMSHVTWGGAGPQEHTSTAEGAEHASWPNRGRGESAQQKSWKCKDERRWACAWLPDE